MAVIETSDISVRFNTVNWRNQQMQSVYDTRPVKSTNAARVPHTTGEINKCSPCTTHDWWNQQMQPVYHTRLV